MSTAKQTNLRAGIRTTILLASLTGLLVFLGQLIGGPSMAVTFLVIGAVINMGAWWFSDKIALRMSHAKALPEDEAPRLHQIVRELAHSAGIPMPRLYLIPASQPNAFATGRSPKHAAVAVTEGITQLLSESELRGVIAHELAHIRNRDMLLQTFTATIAGAISSLGQMAMWGAMLGGRDDDDSSPAAGLAMMILPPIAAGLIQMAISRQREFKADAVGAEICGRPLALASALRRLEAGAQRIPMEVSPAAAPLAQVNPLAAYGGGISKLFSTHPPTEERVARLEVIARDPRMAA
jgi:heat shock protein HtpX